MEILLFKPLIIIVNKHINILIYCIVFIEFYLNIFIFRLFIKKEGIINTINQLIENYSVIFDLIRIIVLLSLLNK